MVLRVKVPRKPLYNSLGVEPSYCGNLWDFGSRRTRLDRRDKRSWEPRRVFLAGLFGFTGNGLEIEYLKRKLSISRLEMGWKLNISSGNRVSQGWKRARN